MKNVGKTLRCRETTKKMVDWILNYNFEQSWRYSWPNIQGHILNVRLPIKIAVEWVGR